MAVEDLRSLKIRPAEPDLILNRRHQGVHKPHKCLKKYWPGALTVVLPCKTEKVPELVRGGAATLGVRMPNHPTALEIIKQVGVPILGPSANFHGGKTPYSFADLDKELVNLVDYVVSGERTVKQASTVIDVSVKPWKVLRQGAVELKVEN